MTSVDSRCTDSEHHHPSTRSPTRYWKATRHASEHTNRANERPRRPRNPRPTRPSRICPECGGRLVSDAEHGETVCNECGLVVDENEIDHGPEWRAFDASERNEKKSRTGAPTTKMMHDKGLSSQHRLAEQGRLRQRPEFAQAPADAASPDLGRALPDPKLEGAQPQTGARRDRTHGERPRRPEGRP